MPFTPTYTGHMEVERTLTASVLVQLTNDSSGGRGYDEAVLHDAIRKAEAEIDMYLGGGFVVPLEPLPPAVVLPESIREIATELTVYWLYVRRGTVPEGIRARYTDAIGKLEKIRRGELLLAAARPGATEPPSSGGVVVVTSHRTRIFTDDLLGRL